MARNIMLVCAMLFCFLFTFGGSCGGSTGGSGDDEFRYDTSKIKRCSTNGYCQGCCSWHGGVACYDEDGSGTWGAYDLPVCADGTPMSDTCVNKSCNSCFICNNDGYVAPPPEDGKCDVWLASDGSGNDHIRPFEGGVQNVNEIELRTVTQTGYMYSLINEGLFTDPDAYLTDGDCQENPIIKWGFEFYIADANGVYNPPYYLSEIHIQLDIGGVVYDAEVIEFSSMRWFFFIPIDYFGDPLLGADPFEELFHQVDSIIFDGTPMDMSTRNY